MGGARTGTTGNRSGWHPGQAGDDRICWKLLDRLNPTIAELSQAIEQEVEKCPAARRLLTQSRSGSADTGVRADSSRERIGFSVASRSRAIWDWCRWRTRA